MDQFEPDSARDGVSRRVFIARGLKVGTILSILPVSATIGEATAACTLPYGSGLYGQGCYAGTLPKVLALPPAQGNVQQDGFRFFLSGEPNRSYRIEYSVDLIAWEDLGILIMSGDGSPVEMADTDAATASRRFYRAIAL